MNLATVSDYIAEARTLLQDLVQPYRYDDPSLVQALNNCFCEIERLRPDLLLSFKYLSRLPRNLDPALITVPSFSANDATPVYMAPQYRMSILYYMCGNAQLRDAEDTQDSRAAGFLAKFEAQMTEAKS